MRAPLVCVVDASVAIKLFLAEPPLQRTATFDLAADSIIGG